MYAKVFKSMFDGTLRGKSDAILVFINMLVNANADGFVDRHFRAIAEETGIPVDRVQTAIKELEAPDDESRSRELDGRRLEPMDEERGWGWRIVNYMKYRKLHDEEARRESQRDRQQRHRDKKRVGLPERKWADTDAVEEKKYHEDTRMALAVLNEASAKAFREVDANLTIISARLKEPGVDLPGVIKMVKRQCSMWNDTRMQEYLRPETLFAKSKFDGYYAAKDQPILTVDKRKVEGPEPREKVEGIQPRALSDNPRLK